MSKAIVVECSGPADVFEAAKWVRDSVAKEGMTIDARAARLVADRVGPDVARLRSDVERLVLYAADKKGDHRRGCEGGRGRCDVSRRLGCDARDRTRLGGRGVARARADDGQRRRALHDPWTAGVVRPHEGACAEGQLRLSKRSSARISPSRLRPEIRECCSNVW